MVEQGGHVVGQGVVPWQAGQEIGITGIVESVNRSLDSYPLPTTAWPGIARPRATIRRWWRG